MAAKRRMAGCSPQHQLPHNEPVTAPHSTPPRARSPGVESGPQGPLSLAGGSPALQQVADWAWPCPTGGFLPCHRGTVSASRETSVAWSARPCLTQQGNWSKREVVTQASPVGE